MHVLAMMRLAVYMRLTSYDETTGVHAARLRVTYRCSCCPATCDLPVLQHL